MIKLIKPYTRIRIDFIAQELNIAPLEVETLLISSILDGFVWRGYSWSKSTQYLPLDPFKDALTS